jgi:hypothetical protein
MKVDALPTNAATSALGRFSLRDRNNHASPNPAVIASSPWWKSDFYKTHGIGSKR